MDHLCYLFLVLVILSCLFIAALWSPAGKGLTSWLLFVMFNCVCVTFSCGILGLVWYLIVSIPDLCRLSFFLFFIYIKRCLDFCLLSSHFVSDRGNWFKYPHFCTCDSWTGGGAGYCFACMIMYLRTDQVKHWHLKLLCLAVPSFNSFQRHVFS